MNLREFIVEKLADSTRTIIQEILTCVFFDGYFNLNKKFKTPDDIVDYYNNNEELITTISNAISLPKSFFDEFLLEKKPNGKYEKLPIEWQKSFVFQCESFDKWIKKHPSFSKNLVFVHHDTTIGIKDGQMKNGWSITKRVDTGRAKYGFKDKDEYQKADIYAVVNDINVTPEADISDEVSYWIQSIEGKDSDQFIGISLKKLKKSLSNVHTYGLEQDIVTVKDGSISCKFPLFDGVTFSPNKFTAGLTTAEVHFTLVTDKEYDAIFAIRSNGKDAKNHAHKDPKASFGVPTTTELKIKGAGAQAGKCQSLISSWIIDNNKRLDSTSYENMLKNIHSVFVDIPDSLSNDSKELLDYLYNNHDSILNLYKKYEKEGGIKAITNELTELGLEPVESTIDMLYNATKWEIAVYKILQSFDAIVNQSKQTSIENTIADMVKYAKGIGDEDDLKLPYVLIGE